ncbi:MAG: hypothetical protein FJ271_18485 [Planctomycetes bacterium]|nr:hypothetical protein [Planctomycetota bacterium]
MPRFYVPRPPHHRGGHFLTRPGLHRSRCACEPAGPGQAFGILDPSVHIPADYGIFSGAPRDEARLLHLGADGPHSGNPDIINLITGDAPGGTCGH